MEDRTYHYRTGITMGGIFALIGILWAVGAVIFYVMKLDEFFPMNMDTFTDVSWFWVITLFFTGLWGVFVSIECEYTRNKFSTAFDAKWDLPLIALWIVSGIGLLQSNYLILFYPKYQMYQIARRLIPSAIGWFIAMNLIPMRKDKKLIGSRTGCWVYLIILICAISLVLVGVVSWAIYMAESPTGTWKLADTAHIIVLLGSLGIAFLAWEKYKKCVDWL